MYPINQQNLPLRESKLLRPAKLSRYKINSNPEKILSIPVKSRIHILDSGIDLTRINMGFGAKIVFLADLHIHFPGEKRDILDIVGLLKPDLVILGGDIWDAWTRSFRAVSSILYELRTIAKWIIGVLGNHEYDLENSDGSVGIIERYLDTLKDVGIYFLRDDYFYFNGIKIYGVDWRDDPSLYRVALGDIDTIDIIVAHTPDVFPYIPSKLENREILVIAGHTHGGQICFPGSIGILTNSLHGYVSGLYKRGKNIMYVSRGVGEVLPRIYCSREILVIQ